MKLRNHSHGIAEVNLASVNDLSDEPQSFDEARNRPDWPLFLEAIKAELQSHTENNTWVVVAPEQYCNIVGSRLLFKIKRDGEGNILKYKARIVAQGYSQQPGVDFDLTYAPVVSSNALRTLLAYAVHRHMRVEQMDVNVAFLNSTLSEKIFMSPPSGIKIEQGKVLLLKKALYGLRQSGRCWFDTLGTFLKSIGFKPLNHEPCIFTNGVVFIAVYVDDLLLASTCHEALLLAKSQLSARFKMDDLGPARFCLGLNLNFEADRLHISQQHYAEKLLRDFGMADCTPVSTPADPAVKLVADDGISKPFVNKVLYQQLAGSLQYLQGSSRPDITLATAQISHWNNNPTTAHWTAALRILRYIKGTTSLGITYTRSETFEPHGYSDADHAGDIGTRRSTSGSIFMIADGPVIWSSHRQRCVSLSTFEAEYVSLSEAARKGIWLANLVAELKNAPVTAMFTILCDNQAAVTQAIGESNGKMAKHIDIRYRYVKELVDNKAILVKWCPSESMVADIFTKPLARPIFESLRNIIIQ